jgi:hypothetical protein
LEEKSILRAITIKSGVIVTIATVEVREDKILGKN